MLSSFYCRSVSPSHRNGTVTTKEETPDYLHNIPKKTTSTKQAELMLHTFNINSSLHFYYGFMVKVSGHDRFMSRHLKCCKQPVLVLFPFRENMVTRMTTDK
jgi:hypothetical protein